MTFKPSPDTSQCVCCCCGAWRRGFAAAQAEQPKRKRGGIMIWDSAAGGYKKIGA